MTWDKLKNFLIILFLCINIFLIICTIKSNSGDKISDKTLDYTVSLVENAKISVKREQIPKNSINFEGIEFEPFGKQNLILQNIKGYTQENGISTFECKKKFNENASVKSILSEVGFNFKNAEIISDDKQNETRNIVLCEAIDKLVVYSSYMHITINKNGIAKFEYKWYNNIDGTKNKSEQKSVFASTVLTDFINNGERADSSNKIAKISYGHYIPNIDDDNNIQTIMSIPAYCICTTDGYEYYYNAFDGTFIMRSEKNIID